MKSLIYLSLIMMGQQAGASKIMATTSHRHFKCKLTISSDNFKTGKSDYRGDCNLEKKQKCTLEKEKFKLILYGTKTLQLIGDSKPVARKHVYMTLEHGDYQVERSLYKESENIKLIIKNGPQAMGLCIANPTAK